MRYETEVGTQNNVLTAVQVQTGEMSRVLVRGNVTEHIGEVELNEVGSARQRALDENLRKRQ